MIGAVGAAGLALAAAATFVWAQDDGLDRAVAEARTAWVRHDMRSLVGTSESVLLRLPGAGRAGMRAVQASRMLDRYIDSATEVSFNLREVRRVGAVHAYAVFQRVYLIRGTRETRQETVYFGFELVGERWRVQEVRVTL